MDAIEFFVLHHERLHMQVARDFLQDLSDEQMRPHMAKASFTPVGNCADSRSGPEVCNPRTRDTSSLLC